MVVCQFFLKGQCRFGDNCRNEHPANARQSGFGGSSWNRTDGGNNDPKLILPFNAGSISNDLTPHIDKPMWPLSSYAPSKHEPLLIAGLDESPEELRVKAAAAMASGNINTYLDYEGRQIAAADQMFLNARNNSPQAYDQAIKQSELPARLAAVTNTQNTTSAFGNNTNPTSTLPSTSSAFSNTSNNTSAFGQPAFGQPTFGQSAFGQPAQNPSTSTSLTAPTGAFGQPLNNVAPVSAFGQPPQAPTTSSVFGQPSALGQSTTSSFIKPASGAFSAFNNTGAFSAGGNSTTPATNAAAAGFSAFASQPSAFSLAAQNAPTPASAFGQPSFGQPVPNTSAPTTTSVFGNPAPAPTSVFGAPSAFGALSQQPQPQQPAQQQQQQQTTPVSAFGANTTPSAFNTNTSNPVFGQSSFGNTNNNNTPSTSTFSGGPTTSSAFGNSNTLSTSNLNNSTFLPPIPPPSHHNSTFGAPTYAVPPPNKSSRTKSVYKPGSTPYDQQIPPNYKEALPKSVVEAFESQKFEWGDIPEWVPPVEVR